MNKGRAGAGAGERESMVMLMSAIKPLCPSILYLTRCLQMNLLCRRKVRKSGPEMKQ